MGSRTATLDIEAICTPHLHRRIQLRWLLRHCRGRLTSASFPGQWKKPPKRRLAQRDIAELAGVGDTWYQRADAGEAADYAIDHLEAIVRTLRMTAEERYYLFWAATGGPAPGPHPSTLILEEALAMSVEPATWPIWALRSGGDILARNHYASTWLPEAADASNLIRWSLLSPEARTVLPDWSTSWAPAWMWHLRMGAIMAPDDLGVMSMLREALTAGPFYVDLWNQRFIGRKQPAAYIHERPLRLDVYGESVEVRCVQLSPPGRSEVFTVHLQPVTTAPPRRRHSPFWPHPRQFGRESPPLR